VYNNKPQSKTDLERTDLQNENTGIETLVVMIATPPFPYQGIATRYFLKGAVLRFRKPLSNEDANHIHFEEISLKESKGERKYSIAGRSGFILYVTGSGSSVQDARRMAYRLTKNIILPKMFYRTDIGESFIKKDAKRLKRWGWIS